VSRDPDRVFVQSLERGLAVMRVFSKEQPSVTLSEAATITQLSRATARRILLTLEQLGYVRVDGRRFVPTPRMLDIGYAYLASLDLWAAARPCMSELVERTQESSSAATLDGDDLVYVARVPSRRVMTIALSVGSRLPAYPTSMGRVLLAELPPSELDAYLERVCPAPLTPCTITDRARLRERIDEAREQGWCIVDQELESGIRSIAAPIRDQHGDAIAALNIGGHAGRVTSHQLREEFLPLLLDAAAQIGHAAARR
jgi:IclR family transcriptional regulator, pca regulon regulatory protein